MPTTIQVSEKLKRRLARQKIHPRQSYEEVIALALDYLEEEDRPLSASTKAAIRDARRQISRGETVPLKRVLKDLGL